MSERDYDQDSSHCICVQFNNKRSEILDTAKELINGDRNGRYGNPKDNFLTISELWSNYFCEDISTKDVAIMMILLKVARLKAGGSEDCWVDIAGYAALGAEVE